MPPCLLLTLLPALAAGATQPPAAGLRLWLDAADAATLTVTADGTVTHWRDKSPDARVATARAGTQPKRVPDALKGQAVVRFDGRGGLDVPAIRPTRGPATVFIVSQRLPDQAGGDQWQRVLSVSNGRGDDNKVPNFCLMLDARGEPRAYPAQVTYLAQSEVELSALTIGQNRGGAWQGFRGDIAEVLIYDRGFLAYDESRAVMDYLAAKWGARLSEQDRGWTRVGELGETPRRTSDGLPLHDQANHGGWQRHEPLWDEFNGPALDTAKWYNGLKWWQGRQPAWFNPKNVVVADGSLQLTMRQENPPEMPRNKGYKDYTSACVCSHQSVLYGAFEVRAKPMRSAGSSSFWFQTAPEERPKVDGPVGNEIDVFEIGGRAPGFERKYNMNLHATRPSGQGREPFSTGGVWVSPWDLADDFHVYGLEWDKAWVQYFVDGVLVRKVENTCWHWPQKLIFDSETMPTWFGMPKDADLPSTFYVDFVRAWQKAG